MNSSGDPSVVQPRPARESSAVQEILARLQEHAALFRDCASEADRLARLPQQAVRALIQQGLFRLWIPKRCAGFELDLPLALQVYAAVARVDGSIGWAVMIGSGGGLFAAYLDPDTANTIYSRPDAVIAGSGAPDGRATREKGGYRVTGCWRYASGAHYATTFTANCIVMEGGVPVLDSSGRPLVRAMAFEAPQVAILPVWDPAGMRGTGSEDFEVRAAFVPEHRSFIVGDMPREPGALYRLPFDVLTELPVAAVGLGIAHHALDAFAALSRAKKIQGTSAALATDQTVASTFATARASWQAAQSVLCELAQQAWASALANRTLTAAERAGITAGCTLAVANLRRSIGELLALSGMSAIEPDSELARAWRDLQALSAHVSISPRHLATAGAALLLEQGVSRS